MSQMTISQALRRVKKLKGQMAELTARAAGCVSHVSDQKPAFEFLATREEIAKVRAELIRLEAGIARANANATIEADGARMTLAAAIRHLQELKAETAWLRALHLREGTERVPEHEWDDERGRQVYKTREVVWVSVLKETDRVAELSKLADRFERLNDAVETANHRTSLPLED